MLITGVPPSLGLLLQWRASKACNPPRSQFRSRTRDGKTGCREAEQCHDSVAVDLEQDAELVFLYCCGFSSNLLLAEHSRMGVLVATIDRAGQLGIREAELADVNDFVLLLAIEVR